MSRGATYSRPNGPMSSTPNRPPSPRPPGAVPALDRPLAALLADLETDAGETAAVAFARLVAGYFEETARGTEPVSTASSPAALAARFDSRCRCRDGRSRTSLPAIRRDVLPDCTGWSPARHGPPGVGAARRGRVDRGADGGAQPVGAPCGRCRRSARSSSTGGAVDVRPRRLRAGRRRHVHSGGTEATFAGLLAARHAALPDAWRPASAQIHRWWCAVSTRTTRWRARSGTRPRDRSRRRRPVARLPDGRDGARAHARWPRADGRRVMAVVATAGTHGAGSSTTSRRSGGWPRRGACGCTSTARTAHRPCSRRRTARNWRGIHRARSIAWDPHKMMLMPLAASVVLVRDEADLEAAFSQQAPYLFHGRTGERHWDRACAASHARGGSTP